jgi:hypothetical protein
LDQLAPFHVVEEESLVLALPEVDGSTDIEPEGVEAQLSHFVGARVEVVAGIQSVVTQELPGRRMQSLGS